MSDPNPYEPPREFREVREPPKPPPSVSPSNLALITATSLFGGILGLIFLGPGDPAGHLGGFLFGVFAGAAIGGILSLVIAGKAN